MRIARGSRIAAIAILGILPLALTAACAGSSPPAAPGGGALEKTNLVVGAVPAETSTALYIAQERGIFAAHGLHVKIETIVSTDDVVPDLLHGDLDVASGQVTSFIAAQAQGLGPFRVLASGLEMGPGVDEMVALRSSHIDNAGQLLGKTIAENAPTGNGELLTDALLSVYSVKLTRVKLLVIPFASMSAALAAHRVDAAYCSEPYCTEMQQKDGATVVGDLNQGQAQNLLIGGYTVTASWLKKYPHTAAAFAASIAEASEVADTNLAAAQHALIVNLHITPEVADLMATGTFPTSVDPVKLQQVADLMLRFGELEQRFNATSLTRP
jgi:NitT/TauT family transport system substrate-binding protein